MGRPPVSGQWWEELGRVVLTAAEPADWNDPCAFPGLIDALLLGGEGQQLDLLVRNDDLRRERPELLEDLAGGGRPVSQSLYNGGLFGEPRRRRQVLAGARRSTPGWTAPHGLVTYLLQTTDEAQLRPAVAALDFPDLVVHALSTLGTKLTPAEQLRGLFSLHHHTGTAGLGPVVDATELSAEVVEIARQAIAAEDGASVLRTATEHAESTTSLIEELAQLDSGKRRGGGKGKRSYGAADLVNSRTELDWAALSAVYAQQPYTKENTITPLVWRSDCSLEILRTALSAPPRTRSAPGWIRLVSRSGLLKGMSGAELLDLGRPAVALLDVSRDSDQYQPEEWQQGWAEARGGVQSLVRDRLGANVPAWRALRERLADFPGTVPELIDEALAVAGRGNEASNAGDSRQWPDAAELPDPSRSTPLNSVRSGFLALLELATTEAQIALLPHLDDRTVHNLLHAGYWEPALAEYIVSDGSPRARLALARVDELDPTLINRLLAYDEPETATSLFFHFSTSRAQKRAILVGIPFGSSRTGQQPLEPTLRNYLLAKRGAGWTTDFGLGSGDPDVLRNILRYAGVKAGAGRLRMMAGLWRRHGPDAVRALLNEDFSQVKGQRTKKFDEDLRTLLDELLALPDASRALDRLRAHTLVALHREYGLGSDLDELIAVELPRWDWDVVIDAHRATPFSSMALARIAELPGCPVELVEVVPPDAVPTRSRGQDVPTSATGPGRMPPVTVVKRHPEPVSLTPDHPIVRLRSGTSAETVLGQGLPKSESSWVSAAIRDGALTTTDLFRYGFPARSALKSVPLREESVQRAMAELIGTDRDAWMLLLKMLPDHRGTLAELAVTVRLAVE